MEQLLSGSFWREAGTEALTDTISTLGVPIGVIRVSKEGFTPIACNQPLTGYYSRDFQLLVDLQAPLQSYITPALDESDRLLLERAVENYQRCVESRKPVEFETEYTDPKTGRPSWSINSMTPIFDEDGFVCRIVITMIDVTYRHLPRNEPIIDEVVCFCAWCRKKVRAEHEEVWEDVATFLHRSDFYLSHGMCDECAVMLNSDSGG